MNWSLLWQVPLVLLIFWLAFVVLQWVVAIPEIIDSYKWHRFAKHKRRIEEQEKQQ